MVLVLLVLWSNCSIFYSVALTSLFSKAKCVSIFGFIHMLLLLVVTTVVASVNQGNNVTEF